MKRIIIACLFGLMANAPKAETNEELIASLPELDRMVACAQAHDTWQYNAPSASEADSHRNKSAEVMGAAVKKYGNKAYWRLAVPEVQAFQLVAMNRASLVLEGSLCKGFGGVKKFTQQDASAPSRYPVNWGEEHITMKEQIKKIQEPSGYYELITTDTFAGKSIRAYMCWSVFAADEVIGDNYERMLDQAYGGKKIFEEVLHGEKVFDQFFTQVLSQNTGFFISDYCQDSNKSYENLGSISRRYQGFGYFDLLDKSSTPVTLSLLCYAVEGDEKYISKAREHSMVQLTNDTISKFVESHGVKKFVGSVESKGAQNQFNRLYCSGV